MTPTEKAYFRAADVIATAIKSAQKNPEQFSRSFENIEGEELEASKKALEHLSRLCIVTTLTETKKITA